MKAADPYVSEVNLSGVDIDLVAFEAPALEAADLVLLLVDHPEFVPSYVARHARLVLDTKGAMRGLRFSGAVL